MSNVNVLEPIIAITGTGAGLFPNRFESVESPIETGTQLKTLDGFYTSSQLYPRRVVDYSIFDHHVLYSNNFDLYPWFFHKSQLTDDTLKLVMGMVTDADPPNLKMAAIKSMFLSAQISIVPVSNKNLAVDNMLAARNDIYNEMRTVFTGQQAGATTDAMMAFVNSESFRKTRRGKHVLAGKYPVFYRILTTQLFEVPNAQLRRRFHEMNQVIVNDDFHEVCKEFKSAVGKNTAGIAVMLQCTQCLYGLLYNGDYGGYPRTPELVECMLDILFTECIRLGADSYKLAIRGVFTGRTQARTVIPSALDSDVKLSLRSVFKWMGVNAGEVEDIFSNSIVWSYCDLFYATADITPSVTRMQIVDIHNNKNTALQGSETQPAMIRRSVFVSMEMLASLMVPVVYEDPDKCRLDTEYGCVLVMVNAIVSQLFAPLLDAFVSDYKDGFLSMGAVSAWPVFTLNLDFIANLGMLAVLWRRQIAVSPDMWTRTMQVICNRAIANAEARTQDVIIQQTEFKDNNLYEYAISGLAATFYHGANSNMDDLFTNGINTNNIMSFDEFVKEICDVWLFTPERVAMYASVVKIKRAKNAQQTAEPIVQWNRSTDNLLVLIDPDFYIYYLVMRLVYNVTDASSGNSTFDHYYGQIAPYLPHVVNFAFNVFHPRFSFAVKSVSKKMEDAITKRFPCPQKTVAFANQLNSPDGISVNIMRVLPAFTHQHRIAALRNLFFHLFVRFGGEPGLVDGVVGAYDPSFDVDAAVTLFNGSAFMTADGLCSGSMSSTMAMYNHARAIGLKLTTENITNLIARKHGTDNSGADNVVVVRLSGKVPTQHRLKFFVSLVGCSVEKAAGSLLDCYWVWTPARDTKNRSFRFTKTMRLELASDGSLGLVATDVPIVDGMEGEYSLVVGSHAIGFVRNSFHLVFEKMCVRTNRVYRESSNTSHSARWVYDGIECTGWHSDETRLPYATYFPSSIDVITAPLAELQPYFGDTLTAHSHLPALFFESRSNWLFFCELHTMRTLVLYVFDFFAQRAVGRSPRYVNTPFKTAIDLLNSMHITALRLSTYVTDQGFVQWFRMLMLPPKAQTDNIRRLLNDKERHFRGSKPFEMFDGPTQKQIYRIYKHGVTFIDREPVEEDVSRNVSPTPHSSPSLSIKNLIDAFDDLNITTDAKNVLDEKLKPSAVNQPQEEIEYEDYYN